MMSSTTTRAAPGPRCFSPARSSRAPPWAEAQTGSVPAGALAKVASFEHQVTGVTVTKDGRVFVNFPRWTEDSAVSVAEVKDGRITPFPDAEWNAWRNARKDEVSAGDHWICVQSVVASPDGNLWVLDPAAPAMAALVKNGPKLVESRPQDEQARSHHRLPTRRWPRRAPTSTTSRFSPDGKTAYITDSGASGALVVVDLASGKARRLLDGDPTTQPDKSVTVTYEGKPLRRPDGRGVEFAADGIALSPDGGTLYWQAIKGRTLYSLPTSALTGWLTSSLVPEALSDRSLSAKVETVGEQRSR